MTSKELREKFLEFFQKNNHKIVESSSLLPTDPSVLFTTAGMQQFKPYYLGEVSPYGKNVTSCQKCFRTSDIEEVGNERHLTFLEMLGNFSFGGYFKEEAIKLAYDFLFDELKMPLESASFTVFEGNEDVAPDEESIAIWKKLGVSEDKIKKCGREDNFWGPTGDEGPCGPTTEIYLNGIEVWNLVFNEYYRDKSKNLSSSAQEPCSASRSKNLTPLEQKGVDTGMGLERLAMTVQGKANVFETDLFEPILEAIGSGDERSKKIIADHIKSAVFLASENILPSNIGRGYILRRILRRAIRYGKLLGMPNNFLIPLAKIVIKIYQDIYPDIQTKEADIFHIIQNEEEKFAKTIEQGLKELNKLKNIGAIGKAQRIVSGVDVKPFNRVDAKQAFYIYQTFGFPLEMIREELAKEMLLVDNTEFEAFKKEFDEEQKKHQEISRTASAGLFKSGLLEQNEQTTKYHTATHLLHAALRRVLGNHIQQKGSNITSERLRFDFSHQEKLTESQLKAVEDLVNQKIKEDLVVESKTMNTQDALNSGALAFFGEKYPEQVTVYSINGFSKEICAGPHAARTGELGQFKIVKEESSGSGIRRIKATLIK